MEDDNVDLYCHEEPLLASTPPPSPAAAAQSNNYAAPGSSAGDDRQLQEEEEHHHLLEEYMGRQRCYAPTTGYLHHLLPVGMHDPTIPDGGVSTARSRGVHYIIYAFGRLGLTAATAFNAVNYLDRFLSINCHLRWETWMVELASVACLSIASKLDEVNVPSLHHLQMEEVMSHSFRPVTIREMELTLLKALQWRLACVTSFSFFQLLLPHITSTTPAASSRCTRLLIRSLSEPSLLRFDPSVIASSALRCVEMQLQVQNYPQPDAACHISRFIRPAGYPSDKDTDECFNMMKALYATLDWSMDQMFSDQQQSPVSVIPLESDSTVNRSAVSRRRLFGRSMPHGGTEDEDSILPDTQGVM